ncbi:MAG: uracil-DNA glycosylase [Christensenellales bacterium]
MQVSWKMVLEDIAGCTKCPLCKTRTTTVPGEGHLKARLMFVGEGPGGEEDKQGRPFVGPAGRLLDAMIAAMGLELKEVYITNIVKCRPPGNRNPKPEEADACMPYLRAQTGLIRPRIIVCLGACSARTLIDPNLRITRDRGNWTLRKGIWMMPTYHPAALLRDPDKKKESWEDLQKVMSKLGELEVQRADG